MKAIADQPVFRGGSTPDHPPLGELMVRPRIVKDDADARLVFEIRGVAVSPRNDLATRIQIELYDTTQSPADPLPIRIRDDLSASEQTASFSGFNGILPAGRVVLNDWTTVLETDYHNLLFARRGTRKLQIVARIVADDDPEGSPLAVGRCTVDVHNPENGYLDEIELEPYLDHLGETLVWTLCPVRIRPALPSGLTLKGSLKALLFKGLARFQSPGKLRQELVRELARLAPRKRLIAILTACMDSLCERGEATMAENRILVDLAGHFNINRTRFRGLMEVHLPVTRMTDADPNFVLGIEPGVERDAIRAHLSREYSKWNARVTHTDTGIRQQAAAMLTMIAQARTQVS